MQVRDANLEATAGTMESEIETAKPEYQAGHSAPSAASLFASLGFPPSNPKAVAVAAFVVPAQTAAFADKAFGPQKRKGASWNCSDVKGSIELPNLVAQAVPLAATARMSTNPGHKCTSQFINEAAHKFDKALVEEAAVLHKPGSAATNPPSADVDALMAPLITAIELAHQAQVESAIKRTASLQQLMNKSATTEKVTIIHLNAGYCWFSF